MQLDAFSSAIENLKDSTMNYYLKNDFWYKQYRKQVLMLTPILSYNFPNIISESTVQILTLQFTNRLFVE